MDIWQNIMVRVAEMNAADKAEAELNSLNAALAAARENLKKMLG